MSGFAFYHVNLHWFFVVDKTKRKGALSFRAGRLSRSACPGLVAV
jgi:hypothetical protein